jgi:hypothetical protein
MVVDLMVSDGGLASIRPISDADLVREKMSKLGGEGGKIAQAVYENVGKDIAIAYGVFAVFALFFNFFTYKGMSMSLTMPVILNVVDWVHDKNPSSGGSGLFFVVLATCSIVVPYFWKHKGSYLVLCIPLFLTLFTCYKFYNGVSIVLEQFTSIGNMFAPQQQQASNNSLSMLVILKSLSIGSYFVIVASFYLAFRGVIRYMRGVA